MVNAELIFEAYLNAAVPYIDMKWLYDPIIHRWMLLVRNQSNQTLWFKLLNAIPNWDFGTSLPGSDEKELGSIVAGNSSYYTIDMVREVPVGETYDGGNLTLKAYTDAGYSNEIASADKYVTIDIQDIENWTDVTIYDFPFVAEACDSQGWTLNQFTCNQIKSVEAGGCSLYWSYNSGFITSWKYADVSRTISIPNRSKVSFSFFYFYDRYFQSSPYHDAVMKVYVDEELVFHRPGVPSFPVAGNWAKVSVNLSQYKGETKTIKIDLGIYGGKSGYWDGAYTFIDRVVIAGKD